MSITKNQHYVPQFYLKLFTNSRDQLYVFDKFNRRSYLTHVRNAASEGYFYEFPHSGQSSSQNARSDADFEITFKGLDETINPHIVEVTLSELEGGYAKVFTGLLETIEKRGQMDQEQRIALAHFITIQLLRTPETRRTIAELVEKGIPEALGFDKTIEFNPRHMPIEHALHMFNPATQRRMMEVLVSHIWMIGINETDLPLYTSDEPVAKDAHRGPGYGGIGSLGIEIILPLTPKYALILYDSRDYHLLTNLDGTYTSLDKDNILHYNSLQVLQSYRHVYCSSGDLAFAAEVCAENPEICEPERTRLNMQVFSSSHPRAEVRDKVHGHIASSPTDKQNSKKSRKKRFSKR